MRLILGLGFDRSSGGAVFAAASFTVLDSDGNSFSPTNTVLDSDGNSFVVSPVAKDSDGNSFTLI